MFLLDRLLRWPLTAAHGLLKLSWRLRRPRTFGAHAVALTPERRIVLVRLRYAPGWRLPGGGHGPGEDPRDAVLRELREEIGLLSHGAVTMAGELEENIHSKRDLASLFIVEDVSYRPRWSWEIEAVMEAASDDLPPDLSPSSADWLAGLRGCL
jgi:8-oxo-dGTP pyrophosphatase MutT (NUDIX family)